MKFDVMQVSSERWFLNAYSNSVEVGLASKGRSTKPKLFSGPYPTFQLHACVHSSCKSEKSNRITRT